MTTSSKKLTPQAELVLSYLTAEGDNGKRRKLTPIIAHMTLGVASLTARIAELRGAGQAIKDHWETDHFNRRYKAYWMVRPDDKANP